MILSKYFFIETCLEELRPFSLMSEEEFLRDKKNPPFVESYLRRALEAVFDIGRHILAKTYGFKEFGKFCQDWRQLTAYDLSLRRNPLKAIISFSKHLKESMPLRASSVILLCDRR